MTSAPMNITGDWNTAGLMGGREGEREGGEGGREGEREGLREAKRHFKLSITLQVIKKQIMYNIHTGNKGGTAMGFKLEQVVVFTTCSLEGRDGVEITLCVL